MTEHLDPNYGRERRSRRGSSALPSGLWAFVGFMLGALIVLVTVLAVRGPSTVVVNSCCCCCQEAPCKPARDDGVPIRGDRIGETPIATPPPVIPPGSPDPQCCDNEPEIVSRDNPRTFPIVPFVPNIHGGGGGSDDPVTSNGGPGTKPTPIPEPGTFLLIAAGAVALRGLA